LYPLIPERRGYNDQIIISHFGMKKSYISLLEREYQETPEDFMIQIWVAEELVDKRQFDSALKHFVNFMQMTEWEGFSGYFREQRAIVCQRIAKLLLDMEKSNEDVLCWLLRAVAECPNRRECWVYLAEAWFSIGDWPNAFASANKALSFTDRRNQGVVEEECWNDDYVRYILQESIEKISGGNDCDS